MGESFETSMKRLEIKKYANRRYYDATHSKHLTLDQIRDHVQEGHDIRVVDAKTSADITAQVVTQIILELDTPKLDSLPVPLLVRLIRMNDQLVKDFIEKYFNQALKSFLGYQQQFEEQIRRTHGLPSLFPSFAAWTKAMLQPFAAPFEIPENENAPGGGPASQNENELREVVADLQNQIAALKKKPGRTRKRTAKRARSR